MTTLPALPPREDAYLQRIGRALRCGDPNCGCAAVPTQRVHCPVHSTAYVPTLAVRYDERSGFQFICASGCPPGDIEQALAKRGLPLSSALYTASGAALAGLSPYEVLIPQPPDWLWPNRIPMGELTIVAGYPASGKTAVALDVAARVSLGADAPDQPGAAFARAPVVIAAPLENPRASLLPRLRGLGADLSLIYHADLLSRLHLVDFSEDDGVDCLDELLEDTRERERRDQPPPSIDSYELPPLPKPQEPPRGPSLPVVVNRLENFITRGSAALLVIDQLEHLALIHNATVPRLAGMLNSLAARTGAAVLALMHSPAHSLDAAARYMQPRLGMAGAVYTIALVGPGRGHFLVPLSPPMHAALPPIPFNLDGPPPIAWRKPVSRERLLALGAPRAASPPRTDWSAYARRFLAHALARGPRPAADIAREAARLGISKHHLTRARAASNVVYTRIAPPGGPRGSGYWLCSLSEHNPSPPAPEVPPPAGSELESPSGSEVGSPAAPEVERLDPQQGRGLLHQPFNQRNALALHECGPAEERADAH